MSGVIQGRVDAFVDATVAYAQYMKAATEVGSLNNLKARRIAEHVMRERMRDAAKNLLVEHANAPETV